MCVWGKYMAKVSERGGRGGYGEQCRIEEGELRAGDLSAFTTDVHPSSCGAGARVDTCVAGYLLV